MSLTRIGLALLVAFGIGGSVGTLAEQSAPAAPAFTRSIEGDWVRTDPEGSGSFGGLASKFTPAVLTPEAAARQAAARQGGPGGRGAAPAQPQAPAYTQTGPNRAGQPYVVVLRPCGGGAGGRGNGALLINPDSGGIHFVVHKDEVIFAGERGGSRHIYTDGRKHPDPSRWIPQGAGHSIGRFEGDVLVVDTVGFTPGNVVAGGVRGPNTRLTERFEVAPDGKTMTVTYTWEDPEIYQKPHTYKLVFDRAPGNPSYAFDDWCDASDPVEGQGITPPPQIQ